MYALADSIIWDGPVPGAVTTPVGAISACMATLGTRSVYPPSPSLCALCLRLWWRFLHCARQNLEAAVCGV